MPKFWQYEDEKEYTRRRAGEILKEEKPPEPPKPPAAPTVPGPMPGPRQPTMPTPTSWGDVPFWQGLVGQGQEPMPPWMEKLREIAGLSWEKWGRPTMGHWMKGMAAHPIGRLWMPEDMREPVSLSGLLQVGATQFGGSTPWGTTQQLIARAIENAKAEQPLWAGLGEEPERGRALEAQLPGIVRTVGRQAFDPLAMVGGLAGRALPGAAGVAYKVADVADLAAFYGSLTRGEAATTAGLLGAAKVAPYVVEGIRRGVPELRKLLAGEVGAVELPIGKPPEGPKRALASEVQELTLDQINIDPKKYQKRAIGKEGIGFREARVKWLEEHWDPSLLTPIKVRRLPDGSFDLLGGHHRMELLRRKGITQVTAQVFDIDDAQARHIAEIDNMLSQGYEDSEWAAIVRGRADAGLSVAEIADEFGLKKPTIAAQYLSMSYLPPSLLQAVDIGALPRRVAIALGEGAQKYDIGPSTIQQLWLREIKPSPKEWTATDVRTLFERIAPRAQAIESQMGMFAEGLPGMEGQRDSLLTAMREMKSQVKELKLRKTRLAGVEREIVKDRRAGKAVSPRLEQAATLLQQEIDAADASIRQIEQGQLDRVMAQARPPLEMRPQEVQPPAPAEVQPDFLTPEQRRPVFGAEGLPRRAPEAAPEALRPMDLPPDEAARLTREAAEAAGQRRLEEGIDVTKFVRDAADRADLIPVEPSKTLWGDEYGGQPEPGDIWTRVVFEDPGRAYASNTLDIIGGKQSEPGVWGVHVTSDPEYWIAVLARDYSLLPEDARIMSIRVAEGDVLVGDPQYMMDPISQGGTKADSAILLTRRQILTRDVDFTVEKAPYVEEARYPEDYEMEEYPREVSVDAPEAPLARPPVTPTGRQAGRVQGLLDRAKRAGAIGKAETEPLGRVDDYLVDPELRERLRDILDVRLVFYRQLAEEGPTAQFHNRNPLAPPGPERVPDDLSIRLTAGADEWALGEEMVHAQQWLRGEWAGSDEEWYRLEEEARGEGQRIGRMLLAPPAPEAPVAREPVTPPITPAEPEAGPVWTVEEGRRFYQQLDPDLMNRILGARDFEQLGTVGDLLVDDALRARFADILDVPLLASGNIPGKPRAVASVWPISAPVPGEPVGVEDMAVFVTPMASVDMEILFHEFQHAQDLLRGIGSFYAASTEMMEARAGVAQGRWPTEAEKLASLEQQFPAEPVVPPPAGPGVPFRPAQPALGAGGIPAQPPVPGAGAAAVGAGLPPVGRPVQPPLAGAAVPPAVPPVAGVPPQGPGLAMAPPPPAPGPAGPSRFATMLPSDEILRLAQQPDNARKLMDWAERTPAGWLQRGMKYTLQHIGVSGTDPVSEAGVLMGTVRADGLTAAMGAVAKLRSFGDSDKLFNVKDNIATVSGRKVPIGDLAEGKVKVRLTTDQQAFIDEGWAYFDDLERLAAAEGIPIPKGKYGPGEHYWARNVMGRMMPNGSLEAATIRGAPSGRWLTALAGFEKPREFDTMAEALAEGFRYLDLTDAAEISGRSIYRRIANKRVLDYVLANIPARAGKKKRFGEVMLPGLRTKFFPAGEDIIGIKKLLQDSPLTWPEEFADVVNGVNNVPRTLTTVFDLGPMFAQLYGMLTNWPKQWARAVGVSFKSAFTPENMAKFLAQPDHAATIRRNAPYGMVTSGSELTAGARGFLGKIPLVGKAIKTGARVFDNMMMAARTFGLEATEYQAKNANDLFELNAFWNKFTGVVEPGALGISRRQQKLESAALFAPRLYRATAGLLLDVAHGGLRGKMARRSLGQMAAATLLGYVGLCGLLKQKARVDPKEGSRWLTVQVGDQYLGIRGALFMTLRTLAQLGRSPEDAAELANRYIRGRFSPLVSTAIDVYNRRDFIGMPIDTPLQLTKRVVADNLTPFWVQGVIESGATDWKDYVAVGSAELAGLRTFPVSPARQRNALREGMAQASFRKSWAQLNRPQKYALEQSADLKAATEEARAMGRKRELPWALFWADVESQREPYRIEVAQITQEFRRNEWSGNQYRDLVQERQMIMARIPDMLRNTRDYKDIDFARPAAQNPTDEFIDAYYKIADQARDPLTGVAEPREIVRQREELKQRTEPSIVEEAMAYINKNLDPQYVQAREEYYEYMRIPQYIGLSDEQAQAVNEANRTYRAMRRANPMMPPDVTRAMLAQRDPRGATLMEMARKRQNPARRMFWAMHPLLSVFYSDLTMEEVEAVSPYSQGGQAGLPAWAMQMAG